MSTKKARTKLTTKLGSYFIIILIDIYNIKIEPSYARLKFLVLLFFMFTLLCILDILKIWKNFKNRVQNDTNAFFQFHCFILY